jgi:hypothetical protein
VLLTGGGNGWILLLLEGSLGPSAWAEAWIAGPWGLHSTWHAIGLDTVEENRIELLWLETTTPSLMIDRIAQQ